MSQHERNAFFGSLISRLIRKENLTRQEAEEAFGMILKNETGELQQGAFLAALSSKGETKEEVAAAWKAIYDLDTVKIEGLDDQALLETSGTGMDTIKTFNISTCASLVVAAAGVPVARHGARALTSRCGTVDMAEALGVDVECPAELVADSIRQANLGLFNGMSPTIHPMALGRILSRIHFGSTLNISASLANPAFPKRAVRGVYSSAMIEPVLAAMGEIGFRRALVVHGCAAGSEKGMDEASVCGETICAELTETGTTRRFAFFPGDLGLGSYSSVELAPELDLERGTVDFLKILLGKGTHARRDSVILNAALGLYVAGVSSTLQQGVHTAREILASGAALDSLRNWVRHQNRQPEAALERLASLERKAG